MLMKHANGNETFYHVSGNLSGTAMVLLHGIGSHHAMWQPQIECLSKQGYCVLVPDLFAHGKSSKLEKIALSDWADQINDLLKAHNKQHCVLVGVSMGGVIAQYFAVHNPDCVRCLILSDTFAELKTLQEKFLGFSQVLGFRLFKLLGTTFLAKGMAAVYKAPFAKDAKQYFERVSLDVDLDQMVRARKAINKINVIEKLNHINIPTLVMVGDQFGASFININKKIAQAIPDAKFVVLTEAMDPSNLVNPVKFNQELCRFLDEHAI